MTCNFKNLLKNKLGNEVPSNYNFFFSDAVGRKFAFIELIKRFKNRRKRKKKKNPEEKQGLLYKKRSHSDGEENILDESDDFIAL